MFMFLIAAPTKTRALIVSLVLTTKTESGYLCRSPPEAFGSQRQCAGGWSPRLFYQAESALPSRLLQGGNLLRDFSAGSWSRNQIRFASRQFQPATAFKR